MWKTLLSVGCPGRLQPCFNRALAARTQIATNHRKTSYSSCAALASDSWRHCPRSMCVCVRDTYARRDNGVCPCRIFVARVTQLKYVCYRVCSAAASVRARVFLDHVNVIIIYTYYDCCVLSLLLLFSPSRFHFSLPRANPRPTGLRTTPDVGRRGKTLETARQKTHVWEIKTMK